ncbi:DUF1998 domain-containing protein [Ferrimicrobium sp.]|uniref:DUF1998 domain-containing protein n=1 Tax=Ferrimicrobium sp. TaxID=2926050 RepID=UPI00260F8E29|nr:DUF1998 domain-containing protein [Ferrimicrobium sp.]
MNPSTQEPTRIGEIRPSQLTTTSGVGAIVDLPGMSVIVRGLEVWTPGIEIHEPRLLTQVRHILPDQNITQLRAAPYDPQASRDSTTRVGVPTTTFPRWLRCPACRQLLPIDGAQQLKLIHRWGRRPDLAKWIHVNCPKQSNGETKRRPCIPARFVVACTRGHIDEFPYVDFVHQRSTATCPGPQLRLSDAGSVLGPRVTITCIACDTKRNIAEASGTRGADVLPSCRGRHPHLQAFERCEKPLKLMVLGASNLWFNDTLTALHLPSETQERVVAELVEQHWEILGSGIEPSVRRNVIEGMPALHGLQEVTDEQLDRAIEVERRRRENPSLQGEQVTTDLLGAEWKMLSQPTTELRDDDFLAIETEAPEEYRNLVAGVVKVHRLREVTASVGFTRVDAPYNLEQGNVKRAPLSRARVGWVPAVERRGEGIFLQLNEELIAQWCAQVEHHEHIERLRAAYDQWRLYRGLSLQSDFPIPRFLLIHTLSHLLLRRVALECGYSATSIRERLYVGTAEKPTAGFLLSTAASDTEGTLGGLVALGDRQFLGRLLEQVREDARSCSSDPHCAEHLPEPPSDQLHGAACHACLFASETSCEYGNRWLHRGVLADLGSALSVKW